MEWLYLAAGMIIGATTATMVCLWFRQLEHTEIGRRITEATQHVKAKLTHSEPLIIEPDSQHPWDKIAENIPYEPDPTGSQVPEQQSPRLDGEL